jgi:hypothetical protein
MNPVTATPGIFHSVQGFWLDMVCDRPPFDLTTSTAIVKSIR